MATITRTTSKNPGFISLVRQLDAYLAEKDGAEHSFYAQYNNIDKIKNVIMLYEDEVPVACGAMKEFSNEAMEIKRMYTVPEVRGKGLASQVLKALEKWAKELGYRKCLLETGKRQTEAIALYKKNSYQVMPNYGQYIGIDNSVCFEKTLA